ncbi:MAG: hypothetical protein ACKPKO_54595, partial [Candidatus Fonsibacter sp.]
DKASQALLWGQHCACILLSTTDSFLKLQAAMQKPTDAGVVWSEDVANAGVDGRAKMIRKRLAHVIATNIVDFP